ncbi:hypothetical protein [Flavobacterium sp. LM4]|uniref:hypothetical protein n=1 Tax=Flavobacterium sp. LM4 TaxID=1938609 RepID=UPI0009943D9B|nr:hypothetical protein [Flavobacterium sp. LM4]OOV17569.1 hypothetical protein BXU10_15935 [Flavobacterium sp. LM4]
MENYDLKGFVVEKSKAIIAVALPEPSNDNIYKIFDIYNISEPDDNKIVIHFKDTKGNALKCEANFELFKIDLSNSKFNSIDFTKEIRVAFHHENDELEDTPVEIFNAVYHPHPIVTPDKTGKGTIRD